jgi:hypothetical protein
MTSNSIFKLLPLGRNNIKKFVSILDIPSPPFTTWTGEYFNTSPSSHVPPMNHENRIAPLETISQSEYWRISGPNGVSSRIRLTLDGTSDVASGVGDLDNLRIVYWNGSDWEIAGGGAAVTGTAANGTITTTGTISFNGGEQYFTIGAVETVILPTAQFTTLNTSICEGQSVNLTVALTGTPPWEITYSDGLGTFAESGILSSPYTFGVTPAVTTTYTLTDVTDDGGGGSGFIFGSPVTITVHDNPAVFNVTSGGDICGATTTTIELSGSEVGFNYQLYRNGVYFGLELAGTGSPLTFSGVDQEGTYTVRAYNDASASCFAWMTGNPYVALGVSATAEITALLSPASICENIAVELEITFTGQPPFTFTLQDNHGGVWTDVVANFGAEPYVFNFTIPDQFPVWNDLDPLPKVYTYTITTMVDSGTCGSGTIVGTGVSVNVFKVPETGPQFHIPNTFGN